MVRGVEVEVAALPPCSIHFERFRQSVDAHYDAKTIWGPWAYLCETCFKRYGPGRLGTGFAQRLVVKA